MKNMSKLKIEKCEIHTYRYTDTQNIPHKISECKMPDFSYFLPPRAIERVSSLPYQTKLLICTLKTCFLILTETLSFVLKVLCEMFGLIGKKTSFP